MITLLWILVWMGAISATCLFIHWLDKIEWFGY